ncbi:MAG: hybrid sensor histidine kinase/response regulator [Anaerolineae bacterium]|nr:hybrid sensor histidine kinase/response regulator [Anaerolineae bacterium]
MTTVLVIEDETSILENIVEILQFHRFNVLGAGDGRTGVELARQHFPDLIICDIMMPILDGYGVLLQLSTDPLTAAIPFIFLTAKIGRSDMRRGMELGADDYITKPFSAQELLAAVNARLDKQETLHNKHHQQMENLRHGIVHAMPHEFRTPLTGIIGYASIIHEDIDTLGTGELRDMSKRILEAANRLHRQIENYLLYAQLELAKVDPSRGDVTMEGETTAPAKITQDLALQRASDDARESDLRFGLVDAPVRIAEMNLQRVIRELIDNAFKFSPSGTPVEIISSPNGSTWMLSITDHGRGMTADQIANIGAYIQFQRKLYEQQGSGLGLAIAGRLAGLHRGQLEIDSRPGKYTTVNLALPIAQA